MPTRQGPKRRLRDCACGVLIALGFPLLMLGVVAVLSFVLPGAALAGVFAGVGSPIVIGLAGLVLMLSPRHALVGVGLLVGALITGVIAVVT